MELEDISKRENLIKETVRQWDSELTQISENYLKVNEIAMDVKMYFALNQLYLKNKKDKTIN